MAVRNSGIPGPGGYWLWPALMAAIAASAPSAGPSTSGNPCPRLIEPVRTASADISAKIVVPMSARCGTSRDELIASHYLRVSSVAVAQGDRVGAQACGVHYAPPWSRRLLAH